MQGFALVSLWGAAVAHPTTVEAYKRSYVSCWQQHSPRLTESILSPNSESERVSTDESAFRPSLGSPDLNRGDRNLEHQMVGAQLPAFMCHSGCECRGASDKSMLVAAQWLQKAELSPTVYCFQLLCSPYHFCALYPSPGLSLALVFCCLRD